MQMPIIYPVSSHTDHIGEGSTFVAIKGFDTDGALYIPTALKKGATTIVVANDAVMSDEAMTAIANHNARLVRVADTRKELAFLSAQAAGFPAQKLSIIGITGTKGKTTTTYLLAHILRGCGKKVARISTVSNSIDGHEFPAPLTTPQADYLQQFLALCVDQKVDLVVMEVAAQALTLNRVDQIVFDGALFLNLSLEHLEFYSSMQDYFAAKELLLSQCKPNAPILINADDEWGKTLLTRHSGVNSFGFESGFYRGCGAQENGTVRFFINHMDDIEYMVPALLGRFNAYNALAAVSMAISLGFSPLAIREALASFSGVPGRLEKITLPNGATCFIDYAHNPHSYQQVLSLLRGLTDHLIVVFGLGGSRDPHKRPIMGAIVAQYADVVILTSDNPRKEDPQAIASDVLAGIEPKHLHKVIVELDREIALKKAYAVSVPASIIAVLGKGPDQYQIIGTQKIPFYEKNIIQSLGR